MSRFLNEFYNQLTPYEPGEQPQERAYIKLNTNESPFAPSPRVKKVLSGDIAERLNLYPDPEVTTLKSALAKRYGLTAENVFIGNGSDDVIAFSIMAFCGRGGRLACPDISYGFYPVYARLFGVELLQIPLDEQFGVVPERYCGLSKNIIIANPNAPTGKALSVEQVEQIVAANPDNLVMMDEAYMDFCGQSCVELVHRYSNLLVIQTFSKSRSLAGLRVGYALGDASLIADLETIRFSFNPYNINSLTMAAATAAIEDSAYYDNCIAAVVESRTYTQAAMQNMGFTVLDSKANFVFAAHPAIHGKALYTALREKGILVRHFDKPRIADFIRVTIGTKAQMDAVLQALAECIKDVTK